jgi:hypothetical protein
VRHLLKGHLKTGEQVMGENPWLGNLSFCYFQAGRHTVEDLRKSLYDLEVEKGTTPSFVALDYAQGLIPGSGVFRGADLFQDLRSVAAEFGTHIMASVPADRKEAHGRQFLREGDCPKECLLSDVVLGLGVDEEDKHSFGLTLIKNRYGESNRDILLRTEGWWFYEVER